MAFNYYGEHSITFTDDITKVDPRYNPNVINGNVLPDGVINTWKSFAMAPKSRPFVVSPTVKEEYVDVPGADGGLDYTEALTNSVRYARRTGSWDFIVDNDMTQDDSSGARWPNFYSNILKTFHGKKWQYIILDDDPQYYWRGRTSVQGGLGNKDYSSVTINYNLEPYKTPIGSSDRNVWLWNDLFSTTIIYGSFSVQGRKARDILNESKMYKYATIYATSPMKFYKYETDSDLYDYLASGFNHRDPLEIPAGVPVTLTLEPGHNKFMIYGNGRITVSYERGKLL